MFHGWELGNFLDPELIASFYPQSYPFRAVDAGMRSRGAHRLGKGNPVSHRGGVILERPPPVGSASVSN